jgi:hypothetical protein
MPGRESIMHTCKDRKRNKGREKSVQDNSGNPEKQNAD